MVGEAPIPVIPSLRATSPPEPFLNSEMHTLSLSCRWFYHDSPHFYIHPIHSNVCVHTLAHPAPPPPPAPTPPHRAGWPAQVNSENESCSADLLVNDPLTPFPAHVPTAYNKAIDPPALSCLPPVMNKDCDLISRLLPDLQ